MRFIDQIQLLQEVMEADLTEEDKDTVRGLILNMRVASPEDINEEAQKTQERINLHNGGKVLGLQIAIREMVSAGLWEAVNLRDE